MNTVKERKWQRIRYMVAAPLVSATCSFAGGAITAGVLVGLAEWGIMDEDTAIVLCVLAACAVGLMLLCMVHVVCNYFRFRKVKRTLLEERKRDDKAG